MTTEVPYRLVFDGTTTGEYDLDTSKKRLQHFFKIPAGKVNQLFTGEEVVVKTNISEQLAMKFAFKIAEAGCECYIEPVPDDNDPTTDPNFVERRKSDRRLRPRRPPRPGAIIPDRRNRGRRKTDQAVFQYA